MGYGDEIDVKQFALYLTPGIVIYSYGYLLPSMIFRWIGILMALCILVLFSVTGGDCRVDPIEDQPAKKVFQRKSDRLKTRRSEHHNAVKPICIIMGIVIFSYGDLLPRIWGILFKCIGSLMVLAQQEDSEIKCLRSKICIPISENHLQKSCIPISENLRKADMRDRIDVACLFIVGIVTYSYSYLTPRSSLMLFQCTGLLIMLLALAVHQDNSERKSLRWEHHNAVKPVSNGSEKIVSNSRVPVVSEDSKVSWALFKKQLAKNPLGEKKAKSLGEKKPLDVKKQGKTVQLEPDKAPMLEAKIRWSDWYKIQLVCLEAI